MIVRERDEIERKRREVCFLVRGVGGAWLGAWVCGCGWCGVGWGGMGE